MIHISNVCRTTQNQQRLQSQDEYECYIQVSFLRMRKKKLEQQAGDIKKSKSRTRAATKRENSQEKKRKGSPASANVKMCRQWRGGWKRHRIKSVKKTIPDTAISFFLFFVFCYGSSACVSMFSIFNLFRLRSRFTPPRAVPPPWCPCPCPCP